MKTIQYLTLLALGWALSGAGAFAQTQEDMRTRIGASFEYTQYLPNRFSFDAERSYLGGLDVGVAVSRRLVLNYQLHVGHSTESGFTLNTGWGQVAGIYLLLQNTGYYTSRGTGALALLLIMAPEGVGYRIPIRPNVVLEPYANPLEANFFVRTTQTNRWQWSGDFGMRLSYQVPSTRLLLEPRVGVRWFYFQEGRIGLTAGVNISGMWH